MQKANPDITNALRAIFLANPKCGINKARSEVGGGSNAQIKAAKEWALEQDPKATVAQTPRAKATVEPKKQKPRGKKAKATGGRVQKPRKKPIKIPKPKHVWERQEGETEKEFEAFRIYLELGPGRTQVETGKRAAKGRQGISAWSMKHDWVKRSGAYDAYKAKVAQDEELAVAKKRSKEREESRQQSIDDALKAARDLRACAEPHLERLKAEESVRMGDVTQALKASFDIERVALDMALGKLQHEHTGKDGGPMETKDVTVNELAGNYRSLNPAQLTALRLLCETGDGGEGEVAPGDSDNRVGTILA